MMGKIVRRASGRFCVLGLSALALVGAGTGAADAQLLSNETISNHRGTDLSPAGPNESISIPYTLAPGSSRAVLAVVYSEYFLDGNPNTPGSSDGQPDDRNTLSISLGGVPMTILGRIENTNTTLVKNNRMVVALLPEAQLPASGSANVTVTYEGTGPDDGFGAAVFLATATGVSQDALPNSVNFQRGCANGDISGGGRLPFPPIATGAGEEVVAVAGIGDQAPGVSFPANPRIQNSDTLSISGPGFTIAYVTYANNTNGAVTFADSLQIQDGCNNRPIQFQAKFSPAITANDDLVTGIRSDLGGVDVLDVRVANGSGEDRVGTAPATTANSTIAIVTPATGTPGAVPVLNPADGLVDVPPGTPAGTYQITYDLCDANLPTICDRAVVTVVVDPAPPILADDDAGTVASPRGADPVTAVDALDGDTINGGQVTDGDVAITILSTPVGTAPFLVTDGPDKGDVQVPPGTPAGVYEIGYRICDVNDAAICDDAIVTVTVTDPVIDARNDDYSAIPASVTADTLAGNALTNDTLSNDPALAADVTLTVLTAASPVAPGNPVPTLVVADGATEGDVRVPAGTPPGTYQIGYRLCDDVITTLCDDAVITVVVVDPAIDAQDDDYSAAPSDGVTGGTAGNALSNDTLGGVAAVPAEVTLAVLSPAAPATPGAPVPTLVVADGATEGDVQVPPGTPAGTYQIGYRLCDATDAALCDDATITVTVIDPVIDAQDDDYSAAPSDGVTGGTAGNALSNDTLGGVAAVPAEVTLAVLSPAAPATPGAPVPTLVVADGATEGDVQVPPGTPAGTYQIGYRLCSSVTTTLCDEAVITVTVAAPDIPVPALVDDRDDGNLPGTAVIVSVMDNDSDPLNTMRPETLTIVGTPRPSASLIVPREGTWTVDVDRGTITFTPVAGFVGNPTPISYEVTDADGSVLPSALVVVTYEAAPGFTCGELIGKVFDDLDQDGTQDPGEEGLPAARLRSANGLVITTDQYGRYSVPCAALPRDIGSTFLLELDPRSLPTGYRVVTENPKTVRLTTGTMRRMNFGATLSRVVNVDLTLAAFDPRTGEMSDALEKGLGTIVATIADTPSTVRLRYFVDGNGRSDARRRMDVVEKRLRRLWRQNGRYQLNLERSYLERD